MIVQWVFWRGDERAVIDIVRTDMYYVVHVREPHGDGGWPATPSLVHVVEHPDAARGFQDGQRQAPRGHAQLAVSKVWRDRVRRTAGLVSREGQVAIQSAVALEAVMPELDPGQANEIPSTLSPG